MKVQTRVGASSGALLGPVRGVEGQHDEGEGRGGRRGADTEAVDDTRRHRTRGRHPRHIPMRPTTRHCNSWLASQAVASTSWPDLCTVEPIAAKPLRQCGLRPVRAVMCRGRRHILPKADFEEILHSMYAVHLTTAHWDAIVACHGIDADVQREAAATMAM